MSKEKKRLSKKKYNFKIQEEEIFNLWQDERLYQFNPDTITDQSSLFTIDTPPPYTNAPWHMGGAIHYSQIDMIARIMRMKGHSVHFPMGLDRNGLPIEIAAEKEFKVNMHNVPRADFLDLCQKILNKYGKAVLDVAYKLGLSANSFEWDSVYRTDDPQYRALTQETFIEVWKKGLVYEDDRPNNWDYRLQTTVADAEIEYEEGEHPLYDIQFRIKETNEKFHFSTTRPELIPAIRTIVFNPEDNRYSQLEGKTAIIPLWNISVKIRKHPMADPEFGSGIVQICSYGDIQDVRVIREFDLDPVYAIDTNGRLTEQTGEFAGMKIKEGREKIVKRLREIGAIVGEKVVPYRFPVSERSGAPIEFIGMKEYYLKQNEFVPTLREYSEKVEFHPDFMKQIWMNWLDRVSIDWPISRRRFYGTEVPVWYCTKCEHPMVPPPGPYYQPWKDDPPFEKCEKCGNKKFRGDERTFDTWVDSSISAYYVTKYPNNIETDKLINIASTRPYLANMRPQGKDIVRTWFHYTMLRIHQLFDKPAFQHAWISGHVVTESGEKMSKRKGNSVNPEIMLERYGGDALRFFGCMEASVGSDIRFSEERLKGGSKFLNKLYNISRFIASFDRPESGELQNTDKWILSELNNTITESLAGYTSFDFHPATRSIRKFTTDLFASQYMELVKSRAYNRNGQFSELESKGAKLTLYTCLDAIIRLIAPITPFITDYIYRELFDKSVHKSLFPELVEIDFDNNVTDLLVEYNSAIWKLKQENGISLRSSLRFANIPTPLIKLEADIKAMHGIFEFSTTFQEDAKLDITDFTVKVKFESDE